MEEHPPPAIFSEDELKRMSRQVKELMPRGDDTSEDDIIQLRKSSDRLFTTACSPSLLATHRMAAWNTLCAFIDELARSDVQLIREQLWEHAIWLRALHLYIDESQYARPKSAKQLLVTLGNALRGSSRLADIQDHICKRTAGYLIDDSHPRQTKTFLQLLTHLFSKDLLDVIAIDRALRAELVAKKPSKDCARLSNLLSKLLRWASYEDFGSVAGRCISVVLDKHSEVSQRTATTGTQPPASADTPVWSSALDSVLRQSDLDIEQLRMHVFPLLFKRSLTQYVSFLRDHGLDQCVDPDVGDGQGEDRLLHAALQSGKELGLVVESESVDIEVDDAALHVPIRAIGALLSSPDGLTRITGLSILVHSNSPTRPLLPKALSLIKASLPTLFADTDANFRGEVFSLIQNLIDRLRAITAVLARTATAANQPAASEIASRQLTLHQSFMHWLLRFLTWELRPTASYQRHISALKSLSVTVKSGIDLSVPPVSWSKSALGETKWAFHLNILDSDLEQLLLDLLVDPFDDVRQTAASILSLYTQIASQAGSSLVLTGLDTTVERAEKSMLASGRADQADGVAHMYSLLAQKRSSPPSSVLEQLISKLQQTVEKAQTSLSAAAKRYPMHGLLTSIRFTSSQQASGVSEGERGKLVDCLNRVWETVKPVLCNDAPEGYEHEESGDLTEGSSKDVLSYCWRALKESSLLLGSIIADKSLNEQIVVALGNLCFSQLSELRHRGAFSTVAQTWITCCSRAAALTPAQRPESLLEQWYERGFDILRNKTTINTRRSAGIPSLLCGLLIADKTGSMLSRAFEDLSAIAQEPVDAELANESSLPQVHALNCIKDILKNTRLGEQSERYVPSSLRLAAESLRSEAWAIRNCGLMLFRGVIDRLLGTSDAYLEDDAFVQRRIPVQQHPGLLDTVLKLLDVPVADSEGARFEGVFPALQMLQRINIPSSQHHQAQDAVLMLTASPSWHVRDKAARTYASLMSSAEPTDVIIGILNARIGEENAVHGALLCIKYMVSNTSTLVHKFSRRPASSTTLVSDKLFSIILRAIGETYYNQLDYAHPVTRSAWINTLVEYMRLGHAASQTPQTTEWFNKHDPRLLLDFLARLDTLTTAPGLNRGIEAIERASLARALALQLALGYKTISPFADGELQQLYDTLGALSNSDADACIEFWRTLRTAVEGGANVPTAKMDASILPLVSDMLLGSVAMRVKCEVQKFVLALSDNGFARDRVAQACKDGSSPLADESNQRYTDQWLQLHAITLDTRIKRNNLDIADLVSFISTCKSSVSGNSDAAFHSREAAALALSRMQHLWPLVAKLKRSLASDSYLIIYDLLNDDDEDVRLLAARTVARILPGMRTHFDPITSSQHLLSHMLSLLSSDRAFAAEAFTRAFGNLDDAVVDQLHAASQQDTALFATEKQNLYIDPAREVKAWSQVLLALPTSSFPKSLVKQLTFWVDEGLYTLTTRLTKGSRSSHSDNGPLGWMSNSDVFVLGLRVIYGVEVLMRFVGKGGKLPMEGSEIVRRLVLFQQALEAAGRGNVLWGWEVRRVLEGVVSGRVRLAVKLAEEVRAGAASR